MKASSMMNHDKKEKKSNMFSLGIYKLSVLD